MKKIVSLILSALLLATPTLVLAQLSAFGGSELSVLAFPQNPGPNTPVRLELQNYSINLDTATITWTLDGKRAVSGIGEKQFVFTTKARGQTSRVGVTATATNGASLSQTLAFTPGTVSLIWEADTSVPVGYRGKALPSAESTVKVVALPHLASAGTEIPASKLVYSWKIDDKPVQSQSGYGRNVLVYQKDLIKEGSVVSLAVSSVDGRVTAEKSTALPEVKPEIHFYEESPLSGVVLNSALDGGAALQQTEATARAVPYYISNTDLNTENIELGWTINNQAITVTGNPFLLTLRSGGQGQGTSEVGFRLSSKNRILQNTSSSFMVTFEK